MTNPTYAFEFNFTSREEYLAERAAWKDNYNALSSAQRAAKLALKQAFRDRDLRAASNLITEVGSKKAVATYLLGLLIEAKAEAQTQYLAAHAKKEAA